MLTIIQVGATMKKRMGGECFMEKIVISSSDIFGMYTSNDAQISLELQMCNCCQSCQAGKC